MVLFYYIFINYQIFFSIKQKTEISSIINYYNPVYSCIYYVLSELKFDKLSSNYLNIFLSMIWKIVFNILMLNRSMTANS